MDEERIRRQDSSSATVSCSRSSVSSENADTGDTEITNQLSSRLDTSRLDTSKEFASTMKIISDARTTYDGEHLNDSASTNLYVKNLVPYARESDLRDTFSKFGEVDSCSVICDPFTGDCRGFGFVKMRSPKAAEATLHSEAPLLICKREVTVERAKRDRPHEKTPGQYLGVDRSLRKHRTYRSYHDPKYLHDCAADIFRDRLRDRSRSHYPRTGKKNRSDDDYSHNRDQCYDTDHYRRMQAYSQDRYVTSDVDDIRR